MKKKDVSTTTTAMKIRGKYRRPKTPSDANAVSAASGPYPVEASASKPSTGTPVRTVSSSLFSSEDANGLPNISSRSDMPYLYGRGQHPSRKSFLPSNQVMKMPNF